MPTELLRSNFDLTSRFARHAHANRLRNGAQLAEQLLIASTIDIVNRIAQRPARIQHLPVDIDLPVRQDIVNRPQDSRHIVVDVQQPVRSRDS